MANTSKVAESVARNDAPSQTEALIQQGASGRRTAFFEAMDDLRIMAEQWDAYGRVVDYLDAIRFGDESDSFWLVDRNISRDRAMTYPGNTAVWYVNETELNQIRARSRAFAGRNEHWKGVDHNYKTYTVGSGHVYSVTAKTKNDESVKPEDIAAVQQEIELFRRVNRYTEVQEEKVTRKHRDGEYFLRLDESNTDGVLRVEFIEPRMVCNPPGKADRDNVWFGVQYDPETTSYERPTGYYIKPGNYLGGTDSTEQWGTLRPATEIQHRKINVDRNSPRGMPTTWFVQPMLEAAARTTTNLDAMIDVRSRIALIRKHMNAMKSEVAAAFAGTNSVASPYQVGPDGQPVNVHRFPRGAIADISGGTEYEMPDPSIGADKVVAIVSADLRAAAAALGVAEWFVSADASNANYSSTLVSDAPVTKTMERSQRQMIEEDLEVIDRHLRLAEKSGRLRKGLVDAINVSAEGPLIISRNRLEETQSDGMLVDKGAMSRKTMSARAGLDPDQEQQEIQQERANAAGYGLDDVEPGEPGEGGKGVDGEELPPDAAVPGVDSGKPADGKQLAAAQSGQQIQTAQDLVLNGAQIQAAVAIVTAVAAGEMPRDSGLGQLRILFNLSPEQAEQIMGSAGTKTPTTPNPVEGDKPNEPPPQFGGKPGQQVPGKTPPQLEPFAKAAGGKPPKLPKAPGKAEEPEEEDEADA